MYKSPISFVIGLVISIELESEQSYRGWRGGGEGDRDKLIKILIKRPIQLNVDIFRQLFTSD